MARSGYDYPPETIQRARELSKKILKRDGTPNFTAIGRELGGIKHETVKTWLLEDGVEKVEFPEAVLNPEPDITIDELINRHVTRYNRRRDATDATRWFRIKIKETAPYGLLFIGDPHLGDHGMNMPLLLKHIEICKARDYIYSINTGDVTNRWVGRLVRKYMDQETTRSQEEMLAEWFLQEMPNWLVWILGNHDDWSGGQAFFRRLCKGVVPVMDWRGQFVIDHPSKTELRIDVAHGRKGHSQWNELHATIKAAKMGESAHIYSTSHTHNYATEHVEIPDRGSLVWLLQLRGYKEMDEYALHKNFAECRHGSSVLAIVDPAIQEPNPIIQVFQDVEAGAVYLDSLRA